MSKQLKTIRFIVTTAIFAAIATILYVVPVFNFALPIFPDFLKIHLDEIPIFILGFASGPWAAVFGLVIKTLIKLPMTHTMCLGELTDLIYSAAFILPCVFLYKYSKNKQKGMIFGLLIGLLSQLIVSFFLNIFVMFPFYAWIFNTDMATIQSICHNFNPLVSDPIWTIGLFIVLPFNLIKDAAAFIIVVPVSLSLKVIFDRYNKQENTKEA